MDQKVVVTVVGVLTFIGGFLVRWALPSARQVADGKVARAAQDYQKALEDELAAHKTPDKDDDAVAEARVRAARRTSEAAQIWKDALDGIPRI